MAGKKLFCELDCSQAYHCFQMADQGSIEMLAFNFASRIFAYRRLAQGLSRALSAFSSFMREFFDKVIKADQWPSMWTISASQPMMLATSSVTWEQHSNAFRKQALNWQCTNVILVPRKLTSSAEQSPHKASNPKDRVFRISSKKPNFQSRKRICRDIWTSWTTTEIMSQDSLNALLHSLRCRKVTKKSWYRRNWYNNLTKSTEH